MDRRASGEKERERERESEWMVREGEIEWERESL
jgi:hypothetical protein